MKKTIASIVAITLFSTSVVFAADTGLPSTNAPSHSKFSAFDNVESTKASPEELNQVSGEFIPLLIAGVLGIGAIGKIANKLQCGKSTCKAY